MDEKKNLLRVGLAVAGVILLVAGLWFLFGDIAPDTGHRDNVESGFNDIEREQREAAASLETIRDRAGDSQQAADRLANGIDASQNAADGIQSANSDLANGLDGLAERNRTATTAIDTAESGNRDVAAELERAATGVRDSQRLNSASQSIITKYTGRISQK